MDFSKKGLRALLISLALVVGLGLFNHIKLGLHFPGVLFNCLILNSIYVVWGYSVYRRFPQKQMRAYMSLLVLAFVGLNLLRTAKYAFVLWDSPLQRYLWYSYYIPIILGPLLMFRAALNIGKPNDYRVSGLWNGLYVPAVLLVCGVLTNDLHQAAFRFAPDFADWQSDYTHGPLYIAVVIWSALLVSSVLALAVRSAVSRRLFKTAWLPLLVLTASGLFGLGYVFDLGVISRLIIIINLPEFICLCTIALWESLVTARIVASNNGYPAVFAASSLQTGLADLQFQVQQTSAKELRPTPEQLWQAKKGALLLPGRNKLLKARSVQGGWFFWTEDIAELRQLNEALGDAAEELAEEHELLRIKTEMDESSRQTAAQNQLYDSVTQSLHPQLEKLNGWMAALPQDEAAFRAALQQISVLIAYCKRRSNLLLQLQTHPTLTGEELWQCFEESAKALALGGTESEISIDPLLRFSAQDAAVYYEAFEMVLEQVLSVLARVSLALAAESGGNAVFRLTVSLKKEVQEQELLQQLQPMLNKVRQNLQAIAARFVLALTNAEGEDVLLCD